MPIVGIQQDRITDLLEELIDKIDVKNVPDVHVEAPNVTVNPPKVTVEAQAAAPVVNVSAPVKASHPWTMTVHRNGEGLIETITIAPS